MKLPKLKTAVVVALIGTAGIITVALINRKSSDSKAQQPNQNITQSASLDSGIQKNTSTQIQQTNSNKGDVNTDIISGDKITNNNFYKDSARKTKPQIKGNNNHVISGDNNNVGINGDVYLNKEKELNEATKKNVLEYIANLQKGVAEKIKCATIYLEQSSSGKKLFNQLKDFLEKEGYIIKDAGFTVQQEPQKSIGMDIVDNCLLIVVGILE